MPPRIFVPAALRDARRRAGLTTPALARVSGVDAATISRYETGQRRPTADILAALADALGVSLDSLLTPTPAARARKRAPVTPANAGVQNKKE